MDKMWNIFLKKKKQKKKKSTAFGIIMTFMTNYLQQQLQEIAGDQTRWPNTGETKEPEWTEKRDRRWTYKGTDEHH